MLAARLWGFAGGHLVERPRPLVLLGDTSALAFSPLTLVLTLRFTTRQPHCISQSRHGRREFITIERLLLWELGFCADSDYF